METRRLGSLEVSIIGLGCNNFGRRLDAAGSVAVIEAALEAGITFFNTADVYGQGDSEKLIGRTLSQRRSRVVIATKFGIPMEGAGQGAHPDYIRQAVEASLRRLNTDYIDLYQLHRPDPQVPIAETLGALDELVRAGKLREIGCSNFSAEQLREAEAAARPGGARFVSVQNEYSLLHREPEQAVLPECERQQIAFLPYFPLFRGLLTGKYRRGQAVPQGTRITNSPDPDALLNERNLSIVESLVQFAEARGHSLLELAFSWLLAQPAVASVIAGAMTPEQVRSNANASGWRLTEADLAEIDVLVG